MHAKAGAPVSDVQGRVELIEALGADTLIHVDVGGVPLVARQNDPHAAAGPGDDVAVELDPSVLRLFTRDGHANPQPEPLLSFHSLFRDILHDSQQPSTRSSEFTVLHLGLGSFHRRTRRSACSG